MLNNKISFVMAILLFVIFLPSCNNIQYNEMPQINIEGNLTDISHDVAVNINATYEDLNKTFNIPATLKWQGRSSLKWPKKNYTIKFDKKIMLVKEWGEQKKYCLKANFNDYSKARNVVSAKLYGQIARTRKDKDEYSELVNCGAIDGYPIIVNLNGKFEGIYTINIPKDKWCFDMHDSSKQAILVSDDYSETTRLRQIISGTYTKEDESIDGMKLEYCSEKDCSWIAESFNKIISFLLNVATKSEFESNISRYINKARTIDTMLFTQFILGTDNVANNVVWTTYDGNVWSPNIYDLDATWGAVYYGDIIYDPNSWLPNESSTLNKLWECLYEFCSDEIRERYVEIRKNILNFKNISKQFKNFDNKILSKYKQLEDERWPDVPYKDISNIDQITSFAKKRIEVFDNYFQVTI